MNTFLEQSLNTTEQSDPSAIELLFGHVAYFLVVAFLAWFALLVAGYLPKTGIGMLFFVMGSITLYHYAWLFWAAMIRPVRPDRWFASHLVWNAMTFSTMLLIFIVTALIFALGLLFAAVVPPVAVALIYGPMILGGILYLWVAYRALKGYWNYLKRMPVGAG